MTEQAFRFPDEIEKAATTSEDTDKIDIQIEDDTPPADRNVEPLPKELADDLENLPDSEEYSKNVKNKFMQYKKIFHDERRLKEAAMREQEEALDIAKKILEENKKLKALLQDGEKELITTYQTSAELEVDKAKRKYKDVMDNGTNDEIVEAQEELIKASHKLDKAKNFRPTTQNAESEIQLPSKKPPVNPKVEAWAAENPWFIDPSKKVMARFALAFHEDLVEKHGQGYVGSDQYFKDINEEVRRRFPEEFKTTKKEGVNEETEIEVNKPERVSTKPIVVAPVTRSTSSKRVTLKASQLSIIKKLGLTPEQYAKEVIKLEAQNG